MWTADLSLEEVQSNCDAVVELSFGHHKRVRPPLTAELDDSVQLWVPDHDTISVVRTSRQIPDSVLRQQLVREGIAVSADEFDLHGIDEPVVIALVRDDLSGLLMPQNCSEFSIVRRDEGSSLHTCHARAGTTCPNSGRIRGGLPMHVQTAIIGARGQQVRNAMNTWREAGLRTSATGVSCDVFVCYHYQARWARLGAFTERYPELLTLGWTTSTIGGRRAGLHPEGNAYQIKLNERVAWNRRNDPPADDEFDLESVALHEVGHALGLNHSRTREDVMYSAIGRGVMKRSLTQADRNCARDLYDL